ncbi:MAG: hypothetical protein QOE96_2674 [Blastocatellia bacterium]|nr:hypothetical protein [Blastocatellia bacterium]
MTNRLIHKIRLGDNYWAVVFPIDGQISSNHRSISPTYGTGARGLPSAENLTNQPAVLRRAEPKQIRIAQPGLIVPFRADLFLELNEIVRQRSADEVIVELAGEVELPDARDTLLHRFGRDLFGETLPGLLARSGLCMPTVYWKSFGCLKRSQKQRRSMCSRKARTVVHTGWRGPSSARTRWR